jgi:hypothetical protein
MTLKVYSFGVAILALVAGCGGEVVGGAGAGGDSGKPVSHPDTGVSPIDTGIEPTDSGVPEDVVETGPVDSGPNHGKVSTMYPAFTPYMPQVLNQGGTVLASPQIVTITWLSDTSYATWEAFDDGIGATAYWSAATSQYGVGAATGGTSNHVEQSTAEPTSWSDTDVANFVLAQAGDLTTSGWPAPNGNILYTIYLPQTTSSTFTLQGFGAACSAGVGGYHDNVYLTGTGNIAYAVVLDCPGDQTTDVTESASHELAEGSTDPYPSSSIAYMGLDDSKYYAWDFYQAGSGTEVGDMCEVYFDSFYTDTTDSNFNYGVQRIWSNSNAIAGHAPCVPAETGSYFNVTPLDLEPVTIDAIDIGGLSTSPTLGYTIPVGKSKTFAVGFYSDGPVTAPWTVTVRDEGDPYAGYYFTAVGTSAVTASIDVTSGQNGQIGYVTVTVNSVDQTKADLIVIESRSASSGGSFGLRHIMPILISAQ